MVKSKCMTKQILEALKLVATITFIISTINPTWARVRAQDPSPSWAKTEPTSNSHKTTILLQYYWHDTTKGSSPTAVQVVGAPNATQPFTGFGFISIGDTPLRVGPGPTSKIVGRAQGLYGSASQEDLSLIMAVTHMFWDGEYNGSTISILAKNSISEPVREFPVIGGTGIFRMARGYAVARTYSFNVTGGVAIVGYNVTLFL